MKRYAPLALTMAALFWGVSGVLTQIALNDVTPMTLIGYRFIVAGLIALLVFRVKLKDLNKNVIRASFMMSILLMVIYISSTYGLKYTSASNAGFIIGSSVILVPFINGLIFKHKYKRKEIISTILCFIGLGLVTLKGTTGINIGDLYCFIDALAYSVYIIYGSKLSKDINIKVLSSLQYIMVTIMTFIYLFAFESPFVEVTVKGFSAILVLGLVCTFMAFYLQLESQVYLGAGRSSRILALIPIFTIIFDFIYFGTILTLPAMIGGGLVVFSTIFIDFKSKRNRQPASAI